MGTPQTYHVRAAWESVPQIMRPPWGQQKVSPQFPTCGIIQADTTELGESVNHRVPTLNVCDSSP